MEKENKSGKDWTPWEASAELARQDYNRMAGRAQLPPHTTTTPNRSISKSLGEATKMLDEGVDADEIERRAVGREEVTLDQPLLCEDKFLDDVHNAKEFAREKGGYNEEDADMDKKHTKRLLIQVKYFCNIFKTLSVLSKFAFETRHQLQKKAYKHVYKIYQRRQLVT